MADIYNFQEEKNKRQTKQTKYEDSKEAVDEENWWVHQLISYYGS